MLAQPDMGTAVVLIAIAFAVATAAGAPWRALVLHDRARSALGCAVAAVALPYRRERLLSFLNPQADPSGGGYQLLQSKIGLGAGHLFGLGLGNSREKWGFLPNPHTDFIFSIIGEELGLVGALARARRSSSRSCCSGCAWRRHAPDRFSQLAAVGISAWLATETIVNVGAVTGVLADHRASRCPFISFGGTSLVIDMAAVGVLVGIARRSARDALAARRRAVASADGTRAVARSARPRARTAPADGEPADRAHRRRHRWPRLPLRRSPRRCSPRASTRDDSWSSARGAGQEAELLGDLGVELVLLPGRGLRRDVSPRAIARQRRGRRRARRRRSRAAWRSSRAGGPRAVVSVGGLRRVRRRARAPSLTARPLVLVDLDAAPGLVHRVLRPFAVAITAAFPGDRAAIARS